MHECNGTAAQQFRFQGTPVQFTSMGSSPAVRVAGKCLDAPSAADGSRVQIYDCNNTDPQRVTVTSAGQLQLRGKCLSTASDSVSNGTPVVLAPCRSENSQIWQFR